MSPLPVIIHVLAIVAGVWGGLVAMDAIAPDPPDSETTSEVRGLQEFQLDVSRLIASGTPAKRIEQ